MLIDSETILEQVKDEDILIIHTVYGRTIRGHWYDDHILEQLSAAESFTEIGPKEYQRNDVY